MGQDCTGSASAGDQCGKDDKASECVDDSGLKCKCKADHTLVGSMCAPGE